MVKEDCARVGSVILYINKMYNRFVMATGVTKALSYLSDPLDLAGSRKKAKKAGSAAAASEAKASEAQAALKANEDATTEANNLSLEEEKKKKDAAAASESQRSALSNYLATEGSQPSRRRFLVGAK